MIKVHACNSLLRDACSDIYDRFETFVGLLERSYGVQLAYPRFGSVGDIKKFCTGLVEGQNNHPWREDLRRSKASARTRMSIAHSLFLFRKLIPNEKPRLDAYFERMTTSQDDPDPAFLQFVRKSVVRMFPVGWDKSYRDKCSLSVLPITSCYESGRKNGGCRGLIQQSKIDREEFAQYVLESVAPRQRGVSRVQAVLAGDKWRAISIPPLWDNALRPFHQSLYDFISRQEWCLRGDATPNRFSSFSRRSGEVFTSGDYESATDNLNSEVQRTILVELIMRSRTIPRGIALHALSIFDSELELDGVTSRQARGQLMGQLLSFPLLCLVNYLAFKFCVPRDVPVKINGDDIVFRSTKDEADRWRENVSKAGLTLSAGKTMESSRFFSLNSAMFDAGSSKVHYVPFLRPKALWGSGERECERLMSLAPRFRSFAVGYGFQRRSHFEVTFLKENAATILRSRRSITRGLGMKVSEKVLRDSGFWHRELFYLEEWSERPMPAMSFSQLKCQDLPPGWVQVSPHWHPPEVVKGWSYRLGIEMCRSAWTRRVINDSDAEKKWMQCLDEGTAPWGMKYLGTFKRSLLGLSRRQMWRWRCIRENRSLFGRCRFSRGEGVWMPGTLPACDKTEKRLGEAMIPPPLILTDPGWFDEEERLSRFVQ